MSVNEVHSPVRPADGEAGSPLHVRAQALRRRVPRARRAGRGDGTTFLTIYAVLLIPVPARLVVGPLGGAGTPANVLGMAGLLWWIWASIQRRHASGRARPIRRAMVAFAAAVLASYVVGTLRPIADTELRSMESGLLSLAAWMGVVLVASDAIPSTERLRVLLSRLSLLGGLEGALGVVQFFTRRSFADMIQIPGLVSNSVAFGVGDRDGFARPAGTAISSIEFGVTITALLPICLYVAMRAGAMGRVRRWFPVVAIAVAIPLSVSRSAVIGAGIVVLMLIPTWSRVARSWAAFSLFGLVGTIFVLVPGFLGAFGKLFTGISSDPSALSRTDSYSLALEFIARSPILGRGFMTFLPEYRILDNQYLGVLIDAGVIGLTCLVAVLVTTIVLALILRARSSDPDLRALSLALAAGVTALAVGYAFFDAFSFPMAAGMSFLLVGLVSGTHRLSSDEPQSAGSSGHVAVSNRSGLVSSD